MELESLLWTGIVVLTVVEALGAVIALVTLSRGTR